MTGQYILRRFPYFFWILTNYTVGSFRDRYWPLCIFSQRQTRHPQDRALLLNQSAPVWQGSVSKEIPSIQAEQSRGAEIDYSSSVDRVSTESADEPERSP